MPLETWDLVEKRAPETPFKDRSGYISNLVVEDLKAAGVLAQLNDEDARFWDKAKAAAKKNPKLKQRIASLLPQAVRERLTA